MKINTIFRSIDGEVNFWGQGTISTFIRLQGCNLNCAYCDTEYARDPNYGAEMTVEEVLNYVGDMKCRKVTITGGEPMLQRLELYELLEELKRARYYVSIETNGSFKLFNTATPSIVWIADYKLPSSKMDTNMKYGHLANLRENDFIKFVVQNRNDFDVAIQAKKDLQNRGCRARFAFSPVFEALEPSLLLNWMEEKGVFDGVLNVQLHKVLNVK